MSRVIFEPKNAFHPISWNFFSEVIACPARTIRLPRSTYSSNATSRAGGKGIAQHVKITSHQRKQMLQFRERIATEPSDDHSPVHPAQHGCHWKRTDILLLSAIILVVNRASTSGGQDTRGNMAEALRFTLGTRAHRRTGTILPAPYSPPGLISLTMRNVRKTLWQVADDKRALFFLICCRRIV